MADLVIRGGFVVDGTGTPGAIKDVAIKDGKILAVGPSLAIRGQEEFDAAGMLVGQRLRGGPGVVGRAGAAAPPPSALHQSHRDGRSVAHQSTMPPPSVQVAPGFVDLHTHYDAQGTVLYARCGLLPAAHTGGNSMIALTQ